MLHFYFVFFFKFFYDFCYNISLTRDFAMSFTILLFWSYKFYIIVFILFLISLVLWLLCNSVLCSFLHLLSFYKYIALQFWFSLLMCMFFFIKCIETKCIKVTKTNMNKFAFWMKYRSNVKLRIRLLSPSLCCLQIEMERHSVKNYSRKRKLKRGRNWQDPAQIGQSAEKRQNGQKGHISAKSCQNRPNPIF